MRGREILSSIKNAFLEEYRAQIEKQKKQATKMKPLKAEHLCSEDFEIRLRRAREEELEIVEYYGEEKASGKIMNNGNGHSYIVSMEKCECEDFRKRRLPCKHILYFAIQTSRIEKFEKPVPNIKELRFEKSGALQIHDDFIPHYWNYFSGKISGGGVSDIRILRLIKFAEENME